MTEGPLAVAPRAPDAESGEWLELLSGTGRRRQDAIGRLHALLLRAAWFEIDRRGHRTDRLSGTLDDVATQAADEALTQVLSNLESYDGETRFTTWASKFALGATAANLRRRAWEGRALPLETDGLARLAYLSAARDAITAVLTARQRAVLISVTLNDIPMDVLAARLGTTRGALYQTLQDARRRLRAHLVDSGNSPARR